MSSKTNPQGLTAMLHYQDGSSDKVYNVSLVETIPSLYSVIFEYGRRGSTLQTGKKVADVDYAKAKKVFDKLVGEKTAKGYKNISIPQGSAPTVVTINKAKIEGLQLALLTPLDADEIDKYIEDDDYMMQEKMDGERRPVIVNSRSVTGANRKAETVALPKILTDDFKLSLSKIESLILDGEQIGNEYYAFDMLAYDKHDYRQQTTVTRMNMLKTFFETTNFKHIHFVKPAISFPDKLKLYEKCKAEGREGVVFKKKKAAYLPGKNDTQFKYKFYESASFVVTGINEKRSVQLGVCIQSGSDKTLPVGNVTIPVNFQVPKVGALVEVRYLYAYQGGSIYQPIYLGERTDININDCNIAQLKYKPNISLI